MLEKTYESVTPPFPAMELEDYERLVRQEWSELLSSENQSDESKFQSFFVRHPCMLPRPFHVFGVGADIWSNVLVSKPALLSFTSKIPDFMWITRDSVAVYVVLIEIEAPAKPWATVGGQRSNKLTQAESQIKDWKVWFSDERNVAQFRKHYKIPDYALHFSQKSLRYILIYGRRDEATKNKSFAEQRFHLQGENETFMTYDRLKLDRNLLNCITVRVDKDGCYRAISVPPTIKLGPHPYSGWDMILDKEIAVRDNRYLTPGRKDFLIKRWPY